MTNSRHLLHALRAVTVVVMLVMPACKSSARCASCGMKLDPASSWTAELTGPKAATYDTPRCALTALRRGQAASGVRLVEYYDHTSRDGRELAFVVGSDVLGPMGPDVVPVARDRAERFVKDHGGTKLDLDGVTSRVLEELK